MVQREEKRIRLDIDTENLEYLRVCRYHPSATIATKSVFLQFQRVDLKDTPALIISTRCRLQGLFVDFRVADIGWK